MFLCAACVSGARTEEGAGGVVVNHRVGAGSQAGSSTRATGALNCRTISLAPQ